LSEDASGVLVPTPDPDVEGPGTGLLVGDELVSGLVKITGRSVDKPGVAGVILYFSF
jgi:hypothetical protein